MKIHLRNALISALGFGLGFVIGYFFGISVFGLLPPLPDLFETGRLILSVAMDALNLENMFFARNGITRLIPGRMPP